MPNIVSQVVDQVKDKVGETDKVTLSIVSGVATYILSNDEREKKAALAGIATYFLSDTVKELLAANPKSDKEE